MLPKIFRSTIGLLVMAVASVTVGSATWAASVSVSPVNLFVIAPSKAGAVSISNQNKAPVRLQIRVFRWRQKDGKDVLEPTRDVIANPPSMEIPGEQTYTIRVARASAAPLGPEESYRLIIDELPSSSGPASPDAGIRMLLRTSLPVFFETKATAPKMTWRLWSANGKLTLEATNSGDRHIKLVDLAVEGPLGATKFNAAGTNSYVLPGSTLRYEALPGGPAHAVGTTVTITSSRATALDDVRQQINVAAAP